MRKLHILRCLKLMKKQESMYISLIFQVVFVTGIASIMLCMEKQEALSGCVDNIPQIGKGSPALA